MTGPYLAPAKRPLDGWSVAALVCGVLPTFIIGVALGVVGLVRTGNPFRRGRWLALTGLLLSLAWFGALLFIVPKLVLHDPDRNADGTISAPGTIAAIDVRPGDCFYLPTVGITLHTLQVAPCAQPHNAQAVADVRSSDPRYPGSSAMAQESTTACLAPARAYLGGPSTRVHLMAIYPTSTSWLLGQRTSHCVLYDPLTVITGDIRGDR